jgi:hypothetical protein
MIFESHSKPSFRERVHALAGKTTYREPTGGGTTHLKAIPAEHMVAGALAFGRRYPGDIGPDIAFDMALGKAGHYRTVCEWVGGVVAKDRSAAAKRCKPYAAHVAVAAYNAIVRGWPAGEAPQGVAPKDWEQLVLFACLLLDRAAEDALALASRKARAA